MEAFRRQQLLPIYLHTLFSPLLGPRLQNFLWSRFARAFDEVYRPPQDLLYPSSAFPLLAPVTSVQPQVRKAREQLLNTIEQRLDPLLVQHFRAVNLSFENQTLGIYQQVTFSALHFLAAIVSSLCSAYPCGLHRLAVHYARTRLRVPLETYS